MAHVPLIAQQPPVAPTAAPAEPGFASLTEEILRRDIPWEAYMSAKLISPTDFQLLRRYDHRSTEMQSGLLEENGPSYVRTFLSVLRNVFKEDTTEYVLATLHNLLGGGHQRRIHFFFEAGMSSAEIFDPLLRLLSSRNWYILEASSKLISKLIAETVTPAMKHPWHLRTPAGGSSSSSTTPRSPSLSPSASLANGKGPEGDSPSSPALAVDLKPVLDTFVPWLSEQLVSPAHPSRGVQNAVSCLAATLRVAEAREVFVHSDGVPRLLPLVNPVSSQTHMQLLYDAVLCVWLLSFSEVAVEALKPTRCLKALNDVARASTKEKIVRVAVLALNNLMLRGNLGAQMVELGLPKTVQSLKLQAWHDEDLIAALESLNEGLRHNLKVLSSFDKYRQEVLSGQLEWSPMHKDPAFWRENIMHFEDNEFQVLRTLVALLDASHDKKTLAIASHDLGQFITNHPSGRRIALDMKAKDKVMRLMQDDDPDVRKQALVCIQKVLLSAKYVSYLSG